MVIVLNGRHLQESANLEIKFSTCTNFCTKSLFQNLCQL